MRRSRAATAVRKEHFLTSVYGNKDFSDAPIAVSQETVVLPGSFPAGTGLGLALRKGGRFSSRQNARSSLSGSAGVELAVSPIVTYDRSFHPVRSIILFSP